jgi:hypothetical protein
MVWWNGTVKGCDTEFALVVKVKEQNNLTVVFVLTEDGNCENCGYTPYQSIDVMIINET